MKTTHLWICMTLLAVTTTAWAYEFRDGQEKDEAKFQKAIEEGIIDAHPFPLVGQWGDWVNRCNDTLPYLSQAIKHWREVADATDMTAEQRAQAEALHKQYREAHEAFDEATTGPKNKLKKRSEEASRAGKDELARKLMQLVHVQANYKLAILGGASEDLLRLLTPEQLAKWHTYRVTKHARNKMTDHLYKRSVNGDNLIDELDLTHKQKRDIEDKAWEIARDDFLPTVEGREEINSFGLFGERGERAMAMSDEKLYPWVVENVLTDMQSAKLAFADQRWHVTATPSGGIYNDGEKARVELGVRTDGEEKGAQIRYTLDGTRPTADSPLYKGPLTISQDTTIRAQCFLDGKLLPGRTATARYAFPGDETQVKPGLRYHVYLGGWNALPQFADLKPDEQGVASAINLEVDGLSGNFGLVFSGMIDAPESGEYTFFVTSDDGSALYINGQKVVDNDGAHGPRERSGQVRLDQGMHLIRVEYFDGGGGRALSAQWEGPAFEKTTIPPDVLKHW